MWQKKKRKRMIRQMLNWKQMVVLYHLLGLVKLLFYKLKNIQNGKNRSKVFRCCYRTHL
jgi:hypothetical protein